MSGPAIPPGGLEIACPKCGVGAGERCRTLGTNRVTDMHKARWLPVVQRRAAAIRAESDEDPYGLIRKEDTDGAR